MYDEKKCVILKCLSFPQSFPLLLSGYHKSREAVANFYSQPNAPLEANVSEPNS